MYDQFVGTKPVEERHRFDTARLEAYLARHVPDFRGPLEVEQFRGGQSNPTFRLRAASGEYVMRRKPPGKLLPSAHAVDREYRVITRDPLTARPSRIEYSPRLPDGALLPGGAQGGLRQVTERAGLGRWHPHELRHSAASLLSATYRHATTPTVEAGAGPMERLFGPTGTVTA